MSLNEILSLLKSLIDQIPFKLFDYILLFAFIGYVIEEESYNIGIVIKRTVLLILSSFLALFLYRFPSILLQDWFFISKGIADGIALLGVWILCVVISGLISHFLVKGSMSSFVLNLKIKIPATVFIAIGGFLSLIWIIVHVFVSLPIPAQAKSLLTSSVIVERILLATLQSDFMTQKIYTQDPSSALHVMVINQQDERKDLRFQTKNLANLDNVNILADEINFFRSQARREELVEEELLSLLASDLAAKYAQEAEIENQASHVVNILDERGALYSKAKTVTVIADSEALIIPSMVANLPSKTILLDQELGRIGASLVRLNGSVLMAVFIFTD